ncbi:MAG: hypothetical protein QOI80_268 [Solirubrobacteraceae bacterium]|jgi:hypothetical protein|nr:hypothetical protein [Solirubrobacteraceae bacterium]
MSAQEPTDEELRAALEEQMQRITVDDVLVQTAVTLINLGGRRLGLPGPEGPPPEGQDLGQAQKAIDGVRALLPLLPAEPQAPVRDALSQLQMAFAREAQGVGEPPADAPEPAQQAPEDAPGEAERAKARAKIWTPPGS